MLSFSLDKSIPSSFFPIRGAQLRQEADHLMQGGQVLPHCRGLLTIQYGKKLLQMRSDPAIPVSPGLGADQAKAPGPHQRAFVLQEGQKIVQTAVKAVALL